MYGLNISFPEPERLGTVPTNAFDGLEVLAQRFGHSESRDGEADGRQLIFHIRPDGRCDLRIAKDTVEDNAIPRDEGAAALEPFTAAAEPWLFKNGPYLGISYKSGVLQPGQTLLEKDWHADRVDRSFHSVMVSDALPTGFATTKRLPGGAVLRYLEAAQTAGRDRAPAIHRFVEMALADGTLEKPTSPVEPYEVVGIDGNHMHQSLPNPLEVPLPRRFLRIISTREFLTPARPGQFTR